MSANAEEPEPDVCEYCGEPEPDGLNEPFPLFVPGGDNDHDDHLELCDSCHLAARILAYSREEPPFVDVGLYQEVTFYARQLATETLGGDVSEALDLPNDAKDTGACEKTNIQP